MNYIIRIKILGDNFHKQVYKTYKTQRGYLVVRKSRKNSIRVSLDLRQWANIAIGQSLRTGGQDANAFMTTTGRM